MTLLRTEALSRNFGGVQAVRDVALELPKGEIRAVIGPNGAGKTTLASMISGRIRPSSGRIVFKERDITGLRSWQRARSGIVYTFQITSIFQNLTCHDNVALAIQQPLMRGPCSRIYLDPALVRRKVEAALARVALAGEIDRLAATLPYAHQRQLEMAMGLALAPELLIMDEPTQGLSEDEIARFCELVREVAREVTVMLIEHNMPVVMALADRITVMDQGMVLAEGTPAEIRADAAVQRAYLGGMMLRVEGLASGYGQVQVLQDFSLGLDAGEVVGLLGRNGAGKTTALKTIMGLVRSTGGRIQLDGAELTGIPAHLVPRHGIAYVPQGRRLFGDLTVAENLRIGQMVRDTGQDTVERALSLFPILIERLRQRSRDLSGGEQQMLAVARALCVEPKVLLMDEPTEGLMPSMIAKMVDTIAALRDRGVSVLLVEQKVDVALAVADRIAFLGSGAIRESATPAELHADPAPLHRHVGVAAGA